MNATETLVRIRAAKPLAVMLPGEEAAAIDSAVGFLIDFCGADFEALGLGLRVPAVRYAIAHLCTVHLANPVLGDVFFPRVAQAAGVRLTELRALVRRRCDIIKNLTELWRRDKSGVQKELLQWLTA